MKNAFDRSRQLHINEIVKCGKDPIHFIENYCKVQHPTRGTVPFKLYDFQKDCIEQFIEHRFNIILKSRQLGISTISAAYAVWLALFYRDKNILVIATKLSTAVNFIKKVKKMMESLPPWLLISSFESNRQEVRFANGSIIQASTTSSNAGRSEAISLLIVDEAAFISNFEELWTSIYPTLSTGGNAIILSTPNGVGGLYYDLYTAAEAKKNDFNPIKLSWDLHPERDQAWFEEQSRQLGSRKRVLQELLCQFIGSGDTFFQNEEMLWLTSLKTEPSKDPENKDLWVWKSPVSGHRYIISADVARGDAKDFSTFHIIDVDAAEVVVEYCGKRAPDKLADLIDEWGRRYYNALACPEQNTFGYQTCSQLKLKKYPKLFYMNAPKGRLENYLPTAEEIPGFKTDLNTRRIALSKLETIVRRRKLRTYSSRLMQELDTFIWEGEKARPMRGKHDDLIVSLAIGVYVMDAVYGEGTGDFVADAILLGHISKSSRPLKEPDGMKPDVPQQKNNEIRAPILTSGYRKVNAPIPGTIDFNWLFK